MYTYSAIVLFFFVLFHFDECVDMCVFMLFFFLYSLVARFLTLPYTHTHFLAAATQHQRSQITVYSCVRYVWDWRSCQIAFVVFDSVLVTDSSRGLTDQYRIYMVVVDWRGFLVHRRLYGGSDRWRWRQRRRLPFG